MSKLYFFRHAQASYLADNYDKLSPKGLKQSAQLGQYLVEQNIRFNQIFVGPLVRQKETLEIVSAAYSKSKIPFPEPIFLKELKEHEGTEAMQIAYPELVKTIPQIQKWQEEIIANPSLRKRNTLLSFQYFMKEWVVGNIDIENIEPWSLFRKTVKKGLNIILEKTKKGETIGVFTSGGTISSITAEALQIHNEQRVSAMNFSVRNTSFTTFLHSKKQFNLLSFNELPHLSKEMVTFV